MLRHLLTLSLTIFIAGSVTAQKNKHAAPAADKQANEQDYKQPGAPMPRMKVQLYKDTTKDNGKDYVYLTDKDVSNDANLLVMMFNPTCSHCEDETDLFEKNIFMFKKSNLVLMANPGMKPYLRDFVNRLHVNEYESIRVGIDSGDFISKVYLYGMLPQINIYDHDRKLLKTFNGSVKIDSLKKYIE